MSELITTKKLYDLMEQMGPEEIRTTHGDRLDEESRRLLTEYETFATDLQGFHADLSRLTPPMPDVAEPRARVVPFWSRRVMPAWSLPLAAAATFFLGMIVPMNSQGPGVEAPVTQPEDTERTVIVAKSSTSHDERIANAFFERGSYFMDQKNYRDAFTDLKMAHDLNEKDLQVLDYLIVITEQLNLPEEQKRYESLKEKAAAE